MRSFKEAKRTGYEGKEIFTKMFEARQVAHVKHLQTKSYSEHKALDGFYNGILDLIDEFIETYQGQYGIITVYGNIDSEFEGTAIDYLSNFVETIKDYHNKLETDTHLQNILDEMSTLIYRTLYKLKNLK